MFNIKTWSDEFFKQPTQPMSKDMSAMFLQLTMMDMSEEKRNLNVPEIQSQFLYQVIDKRAKHIGLELSEPTKVFLMFMTQSPGTAVMYLYALRTKFTSINMRELADTFPVGFLQEEGLEKMWDKQKGHVNDEDADNCLDAYRFEDN